MSTPTPQPSSVFAEAFLDRALARIRKFLLALSGIGILVCLAFFRWPATVGFVVGAAISYLNQRWLERAIEALGERITNQQSRERGGADLRDAAMPFAQLQGAQLARTELLDAKGNKTGHWRPTILVGANLRSADFTDAALYGARLDGANLSDANLSGASMADCSLKGAKADRTRLSPIRRKGAKWPPAASHNCYRQRPAVSGDYPMARTWLTLL